LTNSEEEEAEPRKRYSGAIEASKKRAEIFLRARKIKPQREKNPRKKERKKEKQQREGREEEIVEKAGLEVSTLTAVLREVNPP